MVMAIVVITIIISRIELDEAELGTLNKFMSWLAMNMTALHARVRSNMA